MARLDYTKEKTDKVSLRGVVCDFTDMRVDPNTVPEGKYMYEVSDEDSNGEPIRMRPRILVNFFGTIISDQMFFPDEDDTIWIEEGEFKFID